MSKPINISQGTFYGMWIAIVILGIAFLVTFAKRPTLPAPVIVDPPKSRGDLILGKESMPISPKLAEYLNKRNIAIIMLTDNRAAERVYASNGSPLERCGTIDGTKVTGNCNLQGTNVVAINETSTWIVKGSPICTVRKIGNNFVQVHAGGDGYPAGAYPCHEGTH